MIHNANQDQWQSNLMVEKEHKIKDRFFGFFEKGTFGTNLNSKIRATLAARGIKIIKMSELREENKKWYQNKEIVQDLNQSILEKRRELELLEKAVAKAKKHV